MKNFESQSFTSADELAAAVADAWLSSIDAANRAQQSHHVALSGGRITQKFFAATVAAARSRGVSFERVHFFWADERCVPSTDEESNFRLAQELLFEPLQVPAGNIHRVRGEESPEVAAANAAEEIVRAVPLNDSGQPLLDLIFLGLGEDGHVASLFPGEPVDITSDPAVYRAIKGSPKPPPNRVTLGYAAIAAAREVWMLATGAAKESALRESLSPNGKTPFARVLRLRRGTRIFTDIILR